MLRKQSKINVPFWIHILGVIFWFALLISINTIGFFSVGSGIVRGTGLIMLIFALINSNSSYKEAINKKKKPFKAYFLTEALFFIAIVVFALLNSFFGFWIALVILIITAYFLEKYIIKK